MLIAIISDTHGNSATFKKFADWARQNNIQEIIHCGDIGFADFIKEAGQLLPNAKIHLVIDEVKNEEKDLNKLIEDGAIPNINFCGETGDIEIGGKKIAFTHKRSDAKKLALTNKLDLVFFGHSHQPSEEKIGVCRLINPGELAGQIYRPSFAIYDTETDKASLKIVDLL